MLLDAFVIASTMLVVTVAIVIAQHVRFRPPVLTHLFGDLL